MYDSRLSHHTLNALGYAPIMYAWTAAWIFSNQQVFRDVVPIITGENIYPLAQHKFSMWLTQITPATPFVIYVGIVLFTAVLGAVTRCCTGASAKDKIEELVIVEGLGPFFSALKNIDREFWFREEIVARERLGLKRLNKENLEMLVFAEKDKDKNNPLRSVHNYDILTNPIYQDRFLYVPCSYPNRAICTISEYKDEMLKVYSADISRLVCDLAYMPTDVGKDVVFNEKAIYMQMKKNREQMKEERGDVEADKSGISFLREKVAIKDDG